MNYMEQVAHLLGVELEEEFSINDSRNCKYKFTKNGLFWRCDGHWLPSDITFIKILCGKAEIIKKPILDEVEKQYLTNVIKPFRKQVDDIGKLDNGTYEYIAISLRNIDGYTMIMYFPRFKTGTMYKGMKAGKKYTLEDLGL